VLGLAPPHVDLEEAGLAVAPLAVLLDPLGDGDPEVVTAMPVWVKRTSGSSARLPTMAVWLCAAVAPLVG
jgi:hypothetical protein